MAPKRKKAPAEQDDLQTSSKPASKSSSAQGKPSVHAVTDSTAAASDAPPKKKAKKTSGPTKTSAEAKKGPSISAKAKKAASETASGSKVAEAAPNFIHDQLEQLFSKYAEQSDTTVIETAGFENLCKDSNVDMESIDVFLLCLAVQAESLGKVDRQRFMLMESAGVDTPAKIHEHVQTLKEKIKFDAQEFKQFYLFLYQLCLEDGQRTMTMEMAIIVWKLTLEPRFELVGDFIRFLEIQKPAKGVPKDLWRQLLDFSREVSLDENRNLVGYNEETSAWPVLLDDYASWVAHGRKD